MAIVAGLYLLGVLVILLVPEPIDSGFGAIFGELRSAVPWATQHRVQVAANVALFAPLGWALATWSRRSRDIALPAAIILAVTAETIQSEILPARDGDIHDIMANVTGASIGIVVAVVLDSVAAYRMRRRDAPGARVTD